MMLARFTPTSFILTSANTTSAMAMTTSPRMRGTARRASSTWTTKMIKLRMLPRATMSKQSSRGTMEIAKPLGIIAKRASAARPAKPSTIASSVPDTCPRNSGRKRIVIKARTKATPLNATASCSVVCSTITNVVLYACRRAQ